MKRVFAVSLMAAVVATSLLAPAEAAKKKKKPKPPALVQVDQKMFLRGDACAADARALSVADAEDDDTCAYLKGGVLNDVVPDGTGAGPLATPAWQTWPATDGVPMTLDATKHATGEIYTAGLFPLVGDYPGLAAGNVTLSVKLVGETGGEEKVIGEFSEEWLATPGDSIHTTVVDITPDAALNGLQFTSLTLHTKLGGNSVGQVFYKLSQPSSFVSIPTLAPAS